MASADLPEDFFDAWSKLSPQLQEAFKQQMSAVDKGIVELPTTENSKIKYQSKSPFLCLAPEYANTVQAVNLRSDKNKQVEAVVEMIMGIKEQKIPRGIILNKQQVVSSADVSKESLLPPGFERTASVLGKGNSAGEVIVVKDRKTKQDMALKTISISQFNKDEIYMWIHLGDAGVAPELYHFELKDNKVFFTMQVMTGMNLQDVIDEKMFKMEPDLARSFSLCVLHDMLEIQGEMRKGNFTHNDIHGGNVQLEHSMDIKIFDFGRARSLLTEDDKKRLVKNDVVNLIRLFCCLYSGYDFNDSFEALKVLTARNLHELNPFMLRISQEQRKEMYMIMNELFDTVRDWRREGYGDTSQVADHVKSLITEDVDEIKRKAAVIIFPEKFQHGGMGRDDRDGYECEAAIQVSDHIWEDENMEYFVDNVTSDKLQELGVRLMDI